MKFSELSFVRFHTKRVHPATFTAVFEIFDPQLQKHARDSAVPIPGMFVAIKSVMRALLRCALTEVVHNATKKQSRLQNRPKSILSETFNLRKNSKHSNHSKNSNNSNNSMNMNFSEKFWIFAGPDVHVPLTFLTQVSSQLWLSHWWAHLLGRARSNRPTCTWETCAHLLPFDTLLYPR